MTGNLPKNPNDPTRSGRSSYVLVSAGIVLAAAVLILVFILLDDAPQTVATLDPTTQPTTPPGSDDGTPTAGVYATTPPLPTASPEAAANPTPTAISPTPISIATNATATAVPPTPTSTIANATATAVPPTPRPTQPAASPTAGPTVVPMVYAVASLEITITHPDAAAVAYTVSCHGTEPSTCQPLARPDVRDRLINGAPTNRICTEIYGGPDIAVIVGTYDGLAVQTTVDRVNGCGIDDWDRLLAGILRPARGIVPPPTPIGLAGFVSGQVLATPTCPVQRQGEICPPAPVAGVVEFAQAGRVVASTRTDATGAYAVELEAGDYAVTVNVGNTPFPTCESISIHVVAGGRLVADLDCDTGIR